MSKNKFILPPKGDFCSSSESDPWACYYRPFIGKVYVERINVVLDMLPAESFDSILEIGYGSGILIPYLHGISDKYVGVDIDSNDTEVTKRLDRLGMTEGVELHKCALEELELPQFDLVIAISIFEHVEDVEGLLKVISGCLKPGGHLLIGMPRVDKAMTLLFHMIGSHCIDDQHITSYHTFKKEAVDIFDFVSEKQMPPIGPALYHGGLFKKKDSAD